MKTSQKGINLIKQFEGCSFKPYKCAAGKWTIGYGHVLLKDEPHVKITQEYATLLLQHDLIKFEQGLNKLIKVTLTQNQFDAIISLVFNIGLGNFQASTLRAKLNRGEFELAAKQFDKWVYAAGKPLKGLIIRRLTERLLFESDI
jgi:lysozyme